MASFPDFSLETELLHAGAKLVAGVDEVGRGPLAGPVVASAVLLDPRNIPEGLNDSKKLSQAKRDILFDLIQASCVVGIGEASVEEIDHLNILHASHLAMTRAVLNLSDQPDHLLIDGNRLPSDLPCPATSVVKGDARSQSIAAASIIAKVTRDRHMIALAQQHPEFGWDKNAGYPTKSHIKALQEYGATPYHRRTFKPVHNILCRD